MRNIFFLFFVLITFSACDSLDKFTQFELEYRATGTVQSSVGINVPFNIITPDITTNSEQKFKDNNTSKELIEEIYLKELELTLTSPSGADFSFLKEVTIYIKADGLSDKEIAWKRPVPNDAGNKLILDVSKADIQAYIKKDEFSIKVTTTTDEFISSDHTFDIRSVIFVDAKILGL